MCFHMDLPGWACGVVMGLEKINFLLYIKNGKAGIWISSFS